ncbi:MAG: primosomal protein N' [Bdellovibrionaceae bacterium]|nr:primosomal protein N' [Bdellovibrio sp.]
MTVRQLAHVAVDAPLTENLTYLQNDSCPVIRGDVVDVPLGKRTVKGIVISVSESEAAAEDDAYEIKTVKAIDIEWPALTDPFLKWLEWVSDYYIYPLGRTLQLCFPPLSRPKKIRQSNRPPVVPVLEKVKLHQLTEEQKFCLEAIKKTKGFATHLVHGVTGSGKTEIYLQLFEKTLSENKRGLFLLPEISLTPQLIHRFAERFGDQIAVLHSQLTDRERTTQWWEIAEGRKKILIGARSALFCPIKDLGLIVVDEEHESSFKQDEKLKYNGRDCAIMLGRFMNCPVILGSATPSLDTWKNAVEGKYHLHQLKSRVENRPLPVIEVIDMRLEKDLEKKSAEKPFWLSQKLYNEMKVSLQKKEQVALLLNRRGMAQMVFCPGCGFSIECPNCDISLTLHGNTHMVCHYCDYHENFKTKCPDCKQSDMIVMGLGTEKVEEDLRKLFPEAKIARADRDEVQSRLDMEELVQKMENQEIDILIGTQMIAKGLDFPHLKLVGLLLADVSFNLPDFRASEKSFQLMTQMSGRSGRHVGVDDLPGKVVIQTYNTSHESVSFAQAHDYEGFVQTECIHRKQLNYPPYHKLTALRIQSLELEKTRSTAYKLARRAQAIKEKFNAFDQVEVLGPAAAPIAKLRNQFRYHVLFKCPQPQLLNQFVRKVMGDNKWIPAQVKVLVDVDPLNLL